MMNIINNTGDSSTIVKNNKNQFKVIKISKINGKLNNKNRTFLYRIKSL